MVARQLALFGWEKPGIAYVSRFGVESRQKEFMKIAEKHGLLFRECLHEPPLAVGTVYYMMGLGYDEAIVTVSSRKERDTIKDYFPDEIVTTYKIFQGDRGPVLTEFFIDSRMQNLWLHTGKPYGKVLAHFAESGETEYFTGFWPCPDGWSPWPGEWQPRP